MVSAERDAGPGEFIVGTPPGEARAAHGSAGAPSPGSAGSYEHVATSVALHLLDAMERRDLDEARTCFAGEFEMVFPGPATFTGLEAMVAAASGRYRSIGKLIEATEAFAVVVRPDDRPHAEHGAAARAIVYVRGTLHGVNVHGVPFEGVRFIDRFEVVSGLIQRQDVWNDLAESGVLERRT